MLKVVERAEAHGQRVAVRAAGKTFTYEQLLSASSLVAAELLAGRENLQEARVAIFVNPGFDFVASLWGIWRAGGIAVPLCLTHPAPALEYVLQDTRCELLICSPDQRDFMAPLCQRNGCEIRACPTEVSHRSRDAGGRATPPTKLPVIDRNQRALILYTSGTTSKPKGVVTTHGNVEAQMETLVDAWRWSAADHTLCVLPLHHVHGLINVVGCSLLVGACCEFLPEFVPEEVFQVFSEGRVNVFMAVPTVYVKLISYWESLAPPNKARMSQALRRMRLMVSGSAALPVSVMENWQRISGHRLLERYGMTELGMAISNPYDGERRAGFVGTPLAGVQVRLTDEQNNLVSNEPGEIQVKGENVFIEYWQQPVATHAAFTEDGWFRTGDVAVVENGYYRILGRSSIDIIKSGGYKISALEIEELLRTHPRVADCAVVGLADEEWGEIVAAAIVPKESIDTEGLKQWAKEYLPSYRVPRKFLTLSSLPRNAMGKVTKNEVKKLFES